MSNEVNFDEMFGNDSNFGQPEEVEFQTQTPVAPVPVSVQTQVPVAQTQSTSLSGGVSDDFEIGFSDEMESALGEIGINVGDIGVKVSKVPIERYKAASAKVDRIAFITKRVIPVKFHYMEGIGSILCNGGKCCEINGVPQVRYLFPIALYQTDAEGNFSGNKVELKILSAGEDLYKTIVNLNKGIAQYGGIDHADLLVTCTDDQYQKISLTYAGPATWRKYRQIAMFLKERWDKDGDKAYMAVARKVDDATFAKLAHLDEGDAPQQTFDPSKDTDLSKFFE